MSIEPCFLYGLEESHQIVPPFKIVLKPSTNTATCMIRKGTKRQTEQNKVENFECKMKRVSEEYIAGRRLMHIPEYIGFNHIKASIFCLLYQIFPHLNNPQKEQRERTQFYETIVKMEDK